MWMVFVDEKFSIMTPARPKDYIEGNRIHVRDGMSRTGISLPLKDDWRCIAIIRKEALKEA